MKEGVVEEEKAIHNITNTYLVNRVDENFILVKSSSRASANSNANMCSSRHDSSFKLTASSP